MDHEQNRSGVISLRWVHVVVLLIVQTLLLGSVYGSLKYQVEENTRRIQRLEDSVGGFRETREEILRRLDKIETKIDDALQRKP